MFANFPRASRELVRGQVATTIQANLRYCTAPFIAEEKILVGAAVAVDDKISTPNRPRLRMFTNFGDEKIAGISVFNSQIAFEIDEFGNKYYPIGSRVSVIEQGDIVMYSEDPINYNDDVITRVVPGDTTKNQIVGNLTADPTQGFSISYCRFVEVTSSPGLVIMNITLVGT